MYISFFFFFRLPQSVERSHFIGFACLPDKTQLLPIGNTCTVIGWGKRRHVDETGTNLLHEAEVPIISNDSCRNTYYDYVITKNMFCAGGHRRDTCSGYVKYFEFGYLNEIDINKN